MGEHAPHAHGKPRLSHLMHGGSILREAERTRCVSEAATCRDAELAFLSLLSGPAATALVRNPVLRLGIKSAESEWRRSSGVACEQQAAHIPQSEKQQAPRTGIQATYLCALLFALARSVGYRTYSSFVSFRRHMACIAALSLYIWDSLTDGCCY